MRWRTLAALLAVALTAGAARAAVPLTLDKTGHVVVPAFVNGRGPFVFILDSGADESGVYAWFGKSLGLPQGHAGVLSGATGSAAMTKARVAGLAVDGAALRDLELDTLPDRPDKATLAGVAGVDLMLGRLVVMDFGCRTAAFLPLQSATPAIVGRRAVFVRAGAIRDGKQLTLPVTVNGAAGVAVLDTGARQTIINRRFAASAGVDPASPAFRDGGPTRGVSTTLVGSRTGPIGRVGFAGVTRPGAVARVVDLPFLQGAGLAGVPSMVLGLDLLRGTRLTIDYSSRRFWLARSSCG
jgi:predicted aspartyl protease